MLALKPILGLDPSGVVVRYGQALGARRARTELLRLVREQIPPDARKLHFGIAQIGVPELVDEISAALRGEYGQDVEILAAPATPVIATHVGVGAWAVAYLVED